MAGCMLINHTYQASYISVSKLFCICISIRDDVLFEFTFVCVPVYAMEPASQKKNLNLNSVLVVILGCELKTKMSPAESAGQSII